MGCLKLTYNLIPELKIVYSKKGLALKNSSLSACNYYPFGMRFNQAPVYQSEENRRLFNGKELQQEYGYNMYAYGLRDYSPDLGRWWVIDPMIEKHYNYTPYAYVYNNPMGLIDPDGRDSLRVGFSFKMNTGRFGIKGKIGGVPAGASYANGGAEQKVQIYFDINTETGKVKLGVSHTQKYIKEESSMEVGVVQVTESKEKETVLDVNTKDGATKKEDTSYKNKMTYGTAFVKNEETQDGTKTKGDFSTGAEVSAGIVGVGVSLDIELTKKPEVKPKGELREEEKNKEKNK